MKYVTKTEHEVFVRVETNLVKRIHTIRIYDKNHKRIAKYRSRVYGKDEEFPEWTIDNLTNIFKCPDDYTEVK